MTNQEKQEQKPRANTVDPETARIKIREILPGLSKEEILAIDGFEDRLDKELGKLKQRFNLGNEDMYDLLTPYLSGANIVSKICPLKKKGDAADRRHVNLLLMAAMRRVFGISIDEILDECFQSLPDRQPPKK